MWWHRAAILVACGLLIQSTLSTNASSHPSYREAHRRRPSNFACCPPRQPSPRVVVPYPYLQTNCPKPRAHTGTNNIIAQNTAPAWPEFIIKWPLCSYMGHPIKTNIIIELPRWMFSQSKQTGVTNNAVSCIPSSSSSNAGSSGPTITDEQGSSQSVEEDKSSTLPPEHVSQQKDTADCYPDEIMKNDPSVSKEGNAFEDNSGEFAVDKPTDNDSSTDINEAPCDNDSPFSLTNHVENEPSVSESGNDANHGETADCIGGKPNVPVDTAPDSLSLDSLSDSTEDIHPNPDACELTTNDEHALENNEETVDDTAIDATEKDIITEELIHGDEAIEPQPQTKDGADSEFHIADETETPDFEEDPTKTEKLLESCSQTTDETTATKDAECSTPRTDDGTEIASSTGSEATPTE